MYSLLQKYYGEVNTFFFYVCLIDAGLSKNSYISNINALSHEKRTHSKSDKGDSAQGRPYCKDYTLWVRGKGGCKGGQ